MENNTPTKVIVKRASPGWLGLLGVIFVVAKVFEIGPVAAWSWWLVLLPFYLWVAVFLGIILFGAGSFGLLYVGASIADAIAKRRRIKAAQKQLVWDKLKGK